MAFCKKCGIKLDSNTAFCPRCGTPVSDLELESPPTNPDLEKTRQRQVSSDYPTRPDHLPEGFIIDDRYVVARKLGQGGFGAVYLVQDRKLSVPKALKVIPEAVINDPEALDQLHREAQVMISLNHPNIVRVYDFHDEGTLKYIDMEYVDGQTLTELKLEYPERRIPEKEVLIYAKEIATALAYAHDKNILHRDLKPQNIMVTESGEVKVMDFGIAETVRSSMSRIAQSTSSGTLVYMSPEQLRGKDVGKESDIYSFGALLYDLLSGHPPFYRGDIQYQILNEQPEEIDGISKNIQPIIAHCLFKNYSDRWRNFGAIKTALTEVNITRAEPLNSLDEKRDEINTQTTETPKESTIEQDGSPQQTISFKYSQPFIVLLYLSTLFYILGIGGGALAPLILIGLLGLITSAIFGFILTHHIWKLIIEASNRMGHPSKIKTPARAVGLLFVPIISMFWGFRVFGRMPEELNRLTDTFRAGKFIWTGWGSLSAIFLFIGNIIYSFSILEMMSSGDTTDYLLISSGLSVVLLFIGGYILLPVLITQSAKAADLIQTSQGYQNSIPDS